MDSKEELLLKHQAHYGEKERNIHKRKPNKILKNCVLTGKRDASWEWQNERDCIADLKSKSTKAISSEANNCCAKKYWYSKA